MFVIKSANYYQPCFGLIEKGTQVQAFEMQKLHNINNI